MIFNLLYSGEGVERYASSGILYCGKHRDCNFKLNKIGFRNGKNNVHRLVTAYVSLIPISFSKDSHSLCVLSSLFCKL